MTTPTTARGKRTRAMLVQAGRELLEERGFAETSIDEVVKRAKVSHGTFYVYFDSKDSLLREIAHTVIGEVFAANLIGADAPGDPYARIEAANRRYLAAWRKGAKIMRLIDHMSATSEQYRKLMIELRELFVSRGAEGIRRLQKAGLADPSLQPRLTAIALGAMVEQTVHVWLYLGENFDEDEVIDHLTRLWAGAIGLRREESQR
ncbi:TetR/AcrR family transcriptional regulator [Amycolatopsis jejuensis]|uniref:TetR/AcrR family transcriptional regulator n=1 Tax=Amycolatopsis jejuensis TaxID=330084 RepID=UPI0005244CB6|nr:TetR/AcrR family transcriptional regulator [Amycolatopsis jejuensis]